jgi:hypothetical protein
MSLFNKIENEIKAAENVLKVDLGNLLAAIKGHFEAHAASPGPTAPTPAAAVAVALDTTPEPPKAA